MTNHLLRFKTSSAMRLNSYLVTLGSISELQNVLDGDSKGFLANIVLDN